MNSSCFEFLYIIGRGGFGKVWKVKSKINDKCYALKQMSKVKIIDKKSIKSINSERELLSELYSPFIVNMHYAFQDKEYLYLVMDLLPGGDLRYHISIHKKFSEEQTRFFICGIILSLEYIHSKGIIHRDIKPENLVLDEKGYIRLTDFGIAKKNMEDNSSETSGTPGYMSPEVINSKNHSFPADYFALGVIGYEFMKGERPYKGKSRKEIKEEMNKRQAKITLKEIMKNNYDNVEDVNEGENWSKEIIDFINSLLIRNPEERLGFKGINELKEHLWLRYYPWNLMYYKKLPSPFIPNDKGNFDEKYCKGVDYIGEETKERYKEILNEDDYDISFKNFYYNIDEDKKRNNEMIEILNYKKDNKEKSSIKKNININIDNNIGNRITTTKRISNNKNRKSNEKIGKNKDNKKANFILINFNINNITNNNIERKRINNFFINRKNLIKKIKLDKLKNLIKKSINKNHRTLKSDYSILSNNYNNITKIKNTSPLINYSIRLNDSKSNSKSKNGKLLQNFQFNNSLIQKFNKINTSKIQLLNRKIIRNDEKKKGIDINIIRKEVDINNTLSLSFREKNNSFSKYKKKIKRKDNRNVNTLNESLRPNSHSRIINIINHKIINNSFRKNPSLTKIKSKMIIFNKKIIINNNIIPRTNKIPKAHISNRYMINSENSNNQNSIKNINKKKEVLNNSILKNKRYLKERSFSKIL